MDTSHYKTSSPSDSSMISRAWLFIASLPPSLLITTLLAPIAIALTTLFLSGRPSEAVKGKNVRTVWRLPYYIPLLGHTFSLLYDPINLMTTARDKSPDGIFALNIGATHNVISDPSLVKDVMAQREFFIEFHTITWYIMQKWFGIPARSKSKYDACSKAFEENFGRLMKEPYLSNLLRPTIRNLERNIPQMISFTESDIDLQPWERWAKASYVSEAETDINLMSLVRDMMGHASVPAFFGRAIMEKYPDLLHAIYDFDAGFRLFLMGLPRWIPWPGVMRAHLGRSSLWQALDDLHRALDAHADGRPVDSSWGDLDDVSALIMERHSIFKNNGFEIKERADITILWASVANANLLVYWQLLYILATPGLLNRIRAEVAPFVTVAKPFSIGAICETPKLTISHEGLSKKCPLLKSTFLESLRMANMPWSVRKVATDVVINGVEGSSASSFLLQRGEFVTIPHELHMRDPKYFKKPQTFDPERFLVQQEDGTLLTNSQTIRPFGGGKSMCTGRNLAESECLALVAGILAYWDIQPADENAGWVIPKQEKMSAISKPVRDTRVRIRRRHFQWED